MVPIVSGETRPQQSPSEQWSPALVAMIERRSFHCRVFPGDDDWNDGECCYLKQIQDPTMRKLQTANRNHTAS